MGVVNITLKESNYKAIYTIWPHFEFVRDVNISKSDRVSTNMKLNKANVSDTKASFLDLHLLISDGFIQIKIYDKRDNFAFAIVNIPFLDGDVPC